MTETIISPGIYTEETDQSFIAPGQAATGLAIIGTTEKGKAYVPTDVTSDADYVAKFGASTDGSYVRQTNYTYLQAGASAKIIRVLGNGGWQFDNTKKLAAIVSGSKIISVFHPSKNEQPELATLNNATVTGTYSNFTLNLSGSQIAKSVVTSLNPSSNSYLSKILGTDENYQTGSAFPYLHFANFYTGSVNATASVSMSLSTAACTFTSSYAEGYDAAKTPWILSEAAERLFRFVHTSDGTKTNRDVKVSIANITTNSAGSVYTTFDILVRKWNDTDKNPSILEAYYFVTLDPNSANFIGKVIGDKYSEYDDVLQRVIEHGDFSNKSSYVRVELAASVANGSIHANIRPAGFEAVYEPVAGFIGFTLPSASMVISNTGSFVYSGFNYANPDNLNYLNPVPLEAGTGSNAVFSLSVSDNKFTLPMQGGTDGINFAIIRKTGADIAADGTNVFGYDLSAANAAGAIAYQKALNILANPEDLKFDLLVLPGVIEQYHASVTAVAQAMVEERGDCVYIIDLTGVAANVATAVETSAGIDSSYSATYYPWVKVKDVASSKTILVPPSVVVPQAYAYNDRIAEEWFAPAGLNRGGLGSVIDTRYRLYKTDRDLLYKARINPITKFTNSGVVIWGQKTLQVADTALNRINVRRLLINLEQFIGDNSLAFVFEQNSNATRIKMKNIINPYMESVKNKQGLYAYRVQIDESNNTNDVIDRNQLVVSIYVSPTKTTEFIILKFNVGATGAEI
jgi:hypothetical protein